MQRYITQLIGDIRNATFNIRPPREIWDDFNIDDEAGIEDLSYIEKYTKTNEEAISDITGIHVDNLPPPESLTQEQKQLLAVELEKLLNYFNFVLEFPDNLPEHMRYPVIYEFWKESHVAVSFGENHIELCDMEKENCPFPGHCKKCAEFEEQMRLDNASGKTDVDFNIDDLLPSNQELARLFNKEKPDDIIDADHIDILFNEEIANEQSQDEINGFYTDEGDKIDPGSVAVPGLCIICKKYDVDNQEENLLCLMNRYDQQKNDKFICGAYEKNT